MTPSAELVRYAKAWRDMVPHLGQLMAYAAGAGRVIEFGVRGGASTWALLDGLPTGGRLVSVDIDPRVAHPLSLPERILDDERWHLIIGDSRLVDLEERPDFVLIDSGHGYDLTRDELWRAAGLEARRIALHDYLYVHDPACQVREAVDRFVEIGPYRWEELHHSDWGLAVLVPR